MGQSMGISMPLTKVVLLQKHKSGLPITRNTVWMNPENTIVRFKSHYFLSIKICKLYKVSSSVENCSNTKASQSVLQFNSLIVKVKGKAVPLQA
jgi:hypothetical protein